MAFISVFDVIGPNMIGPSSSHTAGADSLAFLAQKMISGPLKKAEFILYGSFAKTYRGHGTDRALLGGIMGFATDDRRIPDSFSIAEKRGLEYHFTANETEEVDHPNTVDIIMTNEEDTPGVVAHITRCLAEDNINIAFMKLFREEKGQTAYSIVESDDDLPDSLCGRILQNPSVRDVMLVHL